MRPSSPEAFNRIRLHADVQMVAPSITPSSWPLPPSRRSRPVEELPAHAGVQSGGEGTSGLYVPAQSDQNLIVLDGVLYSVSHLFGFFSVFNSDAVGK